ncbi:translocator protein, LysE family [Heyndrickxia coagulans]|uniref:Translocator protein, LysE family n=1 Tax=Heyndrickxia coagulans TaxID=1398 RepID=A0A133K998_HEYCO|nr:translocator protein, LysE family [Heyndrickxia coagulans]
MYKFSAGGMGDVDIGLFAGYVFLGLSLAAPIGPVNSARIDKGIKNGFWHAWMVGTGSMITDGIFMAAVYLGLVRFLNIEMVQVFLWLFGGFILIYTGVESVISSKTITVDLYRKKDPLAACFLTGFIMSITSPLSILFWLGIYGSVLAKTAGHYGTGMLLAYSSMIFVGLAIWDVFIAGLTGGFRRYFNHRTLQIISLASGASLIGFGLYFGVQGIKTLLS